MAAPATQLRPSSHDDEVEISVAAISAYGRLLRAVSGPLRTHAAGDGGLICEDRTVQARPILWRVAADGAVVPDSPYSFITGTFTTAKLPAGLTRA
jgi:hypothetical protein